MPYTIENVTDATTSDMLNYLRRHEERSLFLLGNFENHGFKMTDAPYSGNFKLIRQAGSVVGVFCLSKQGNLVVQSDVREPVFDKLLQACKEEQVPLTGLLGDWNTTSPLWEYLKTQSVIKLEHYASKELLYSVELGKQNCQPQTNVRLLTQTDYTSWKRLRLAYIKELGFTCNLTENEMLNQFHWKTKQKIAWALFHEGKLVAIADLNAKALDLGQLGGVFTLPDYRQRGFAKALVQQIVLDITALHNLRKLIIFTNEKNLSARKVYESLAVDQIGHYGILFGR